MIREFLFKVLVEMYNKKILFKLKPNKMLDKFNIKLIHYLIKIMKIKKSLLINTKYLHSTKPLLCFSKCRVHYYNDTIKFFSRISSINLFFI